ncbi:MAG TPA: acyltransferase [Flavobacteriales bacterium]|nr:acyltransferase [Flavobacteriales bacterium]
MANALKDERHRGNGFTFLRLVFALSVLYAHSFAFGPVPEPLWQLSNGTLAISGIAVDGFFVISGFLVWRSMRASAGPWTYLAKRGLRLLPALVAVMVLSVLLGALFTSLGPAEYWTHPQLWYFLSNPFWMLRGGVHFNLPGVFTELPVHAVNVSLWTIPYEIFFYLLLLLPFLVPRNAKVLVPLLGMVYLLAFAIIQMDVSYIFPHTSFELDRIARLSPFFVGGVIIAQLGAEHWFAKPWVFLSILAVLALATVLFNPSDAFWYILLPPLVIGCAVLPIWANTGSFVPMDISYGVYLAGWPIQQLLFSTFGLTDWSMFAASLVVTCGYGLLSWRLVEAPVLAWKRALPGR